MNPLHRLQAAAAAARAMHCWAALLPGGEHARHYYGHACTAGRCAPVCLGVRCCRPCQYAPKVPAGTVQPSHMHSIVSCTAHQEALLTSSVLHAVAVMRCFVMTDASMRFFFTALSAVVQEMHLLSSLLRHRQRAFSPCSRSSPG